MSQQPIIRNVTTMDRGPVVRVTTEDVLKAVRAYKGDFTTFEIAERMGVPEYPVRAAMSWLLKRNLIERAGEKKRYTATAHVPYWATTYQVREHGGAPDFSALNRAFGYGYATL